MASESSPDSQSTQPPYKDQLTAAARAARHPPSASPDNTSSPGLLEKVADYIPGAAKVLGTGTEKNDQAQHEAALPKPTSSTPSRPEHDDHIAEFVRDQHRSKRVEGANES
ncbi:hypothetical protein NPX13_g7017 [Xylaria arbuscula]|uniref:Uncharacterized protein n=1 Tax=Xylaria arbuscula TaxID=114810 RepID=A0A9W8NB48_9PEZI|nr:hypothetical protein NPX13_g7017 [Xylaria arbuscula]